MKHHFYVLLLLPLTASLASAQEFYVGGGPAYLTSSGHWASELDPGYTVNFTVNLSPAKQFAPMVSARYARFPNAVNGIVGGGLLIAGVGAGVKVTLFRTAPVRPHLAGTLGLARDTFLSSRRATNLPPHESEGRSYTALLADFAAGLDFSLSRKLRMNVRVTFSAPGELFVTRSFYGGGVGLAYRL